MAKLICMSFDGEYQTERPVFQDSDKAWEYSNDLGSKWYFYPFHFVVSDSGKTIVDTPDLFSWARGLRVKTVSKFFAINSSREEAHGMDSEAFAFYLMEQ